MYTQLKGATLLLVSLSLLFVGCFLGQTKRRELPNRLLGEEVVFVPKVLQNDTLLLETTTYTLPGSLKKPLVVINHGMQPLKNHHEQRRFRPEILAAFFLARGYLVAVPMREGFSNSTGTCVRDCDHVEYALRYAGDIKATIDHFIKKNIVDTNYIVVVGHSDGGIVTLGYAASSPQAKAVINIAGGTRINSLDCDWKASMVKAAEILGKSTTIKSLWLYTKDDDFFDPTVSRPFFEAYNKSGGKASMILFSEGGHGFGLTHTSEQLWGKTMMEFLKVNGLPFQPLW